MNSRLFWLALGTFAIGVEGFVVGSLLPQIAADTRVSLVQSGYLVVAFALTYAVGSPILAAVTGPHDRRLILSGSALVFAAGALAAGLSSGFAMLMGARLVIAVAAGLYTATAQATAVAISHADHRARAISIIVGGTSLAVAFGAPLGAFVAYLVGWRGTYFCIAVAGLLACAAIWFMLPKGLRGLRLPLRTRLAVLSQPGIRPALLTTLLYITGGFALFTYLVPVATDVFGIGRAALPAVLLIYGLGAAVGNAVGGQLADRWGARRTITAAIGSNAAMLALFSLMGHLPQTIGAPLFVVGLALWGMLTWSFPPAQASRILTIAPDAAPLALSLNGSALYLGVALGSFIGGLMIQHGAIASLGWVAALFPLCALAVVILSGGSTRSAPLPAEAR
ncbi:MFS transporter [Microvirga pudoricolor]|uniref:MFS transporter n=1 Tax=Microvirga pudoricolor TaxID=2778729 RepID=UPI00194E8F03|nr:MFS transporter [Microvirga pudoricolor]MBM6594303.1 MFS transporter [Microvirga pudoricolor]